MEEFIGTKVIKAKSMNLGDYNKFKGWDIPENEDPNREGYLVEYSDDYISWSPKEAFEEAYTQFHRKGDPQAVIKVKDTHAFEIPLYEVKDGVGIVLSDEMLEVLWVRGSKVEDENIKPKQNGVIAEQLLEVCKRHLLYVNTGLFENQETYKAIKGIDAALSALYTRKLKREEAGVLGTYKK